MESSLLIDKHDITRRIDKRHQYLEDKDNAPTYYFKKMEELLLKNYPNSEAYKEMFYKNIKDYFPLLALRNGWVSDDTVRHFILLTKGQQKSDEFEFYINALKRFSIKFGHDKVMRLLESGSSFLSRHDGFKRLIASVLGIKQGGKRSNKNYSRKSKKSKKSKKSNKTRKH
jgi:hypothetical protein